MSDFKHYLEKYEEYGVVEEVHPPIVKISGLPSATLNEVVIFEGDHLGQIFSLKRGHAQVLMFFKNGVKVGSKLSRTGQSLSVPVGDELLGEVINPLGEQVFKRPGSKKPQEKRALESSPPGISGRVRIKQPFVTGTTLVDLMVPLGKGQKELILGDRKTGKTSFILSAIRYQVKQEDAVVIYAVIGRQKAEIKRLEEYFKEENLQKKMVMVVSDSFCSPGLIYLTPYTAMAIAEYFRDKGQDVVVVFDDLSTHGQYYRELALTARRFPGRDSYPGDIFSIHARLLERAGSFKVGDKQVSVTAFPICETIEGDISSFISTNLIGITDGHIYFDSNLYNEGRRPAVNASLSVTRVGKQTQTELLKDVNKSLSLFYSRLERLQNLAHFGAELTQEVKQTLVIGENLNLFFNQGPKTLVPLSVQLVLLGLIFEQLVDFKDQEEVERVRQKLLDSYFENKEAKKLIDGLCTVNSLGLLQEGIYKNHERIKQLYEI